MTVSPVLAGAIAALALALLAGLFLLYGNPLFEIYLSGWTLC